MSGIAIIIRKADFSQRGLGKITFTEGGGGGSEGGGGGIETDPINDLVKQRIKDIQSDGGTLIYLSESETIKRVKEHKKTLGDTPKLDFIGYKGSSSAVTKLYSLDSTFDTQDGDEINNITIANQMIKSSGERSCIVYKRLIRSLYKVYYRASKAPTRGDQYYESFCGNLLGVDARNVLFIMDKGKHFNVQFDTDHVEGYGSDYVGDAPIQFLIELKRDMGFPIAEIQSLVVNQKNVLTTKTAGDDYWGQQYEKNSSIGVGAGALLILGC